MTNIARQIADRGNAWESVQRRWPNFTADWHLFADFMEVALQDSLRLNTAKSFLEQAGLNPESKMVQALKASYGQTVSLTGAPRLDTQKSFHVSASAAEMIPLKRDGGSSSGSAASVAASEITEDLWNRLMPMVHQAAQAEANKTVVGLVKDLQVQLNAAFDAWMQKFLSKV